MPYPSNADVPDDVKRRFSGHCRTVWRETWNETRERHHDEGRAFATAETAGQNCVNATKTTTSAGDTSYTFTPDMAVKAEWDSAYVSNLADSAFACIDGGGEKDEDGKTTPRSLRHYPHHNAAGDVDLPHLRNALSRVAQEATTSCGVSHLRDHAKEEGVGERAVKFVEGSDNIIEGLAIPYGGPFNGKDLHGEYFSAGTDLALDWFPSERRPVLFNHGLDEGTKTTVVGWQTEREDLDVGRWAKIQLDKRNRYYEKIRQMVTDGELSFSSGSLAHLVKTERSGHIKAWPWVELSLTPTPANPVAVAYNVKASEAIDHIAAVKADIPEPLKEAIDEWAGPEPDLPERIEAVSAEVRHLVERAQHHAEVRAKAGRVLSAANRERLRSHLTMIGELRKDLRELLDSTDPEAQARKDREFLELLSLTRPA